MDVSELFVEFVLTFEDADILEEWANEYGHDQETIVIQHIQNLRNAHHNQTHRDILNMPQVSHSIYKFKMYFIDICHQITTSKI